MLPKKMPILFSAPHEQASSAAQSILSRNNYDYIAGAAGDERTLHANLQAFSSILFRPHCLVPVRHVDPSVTLLHLGKLPIPLIIAPMAAHKLAHPEGEHAVARSAKAAKIPLIVSTFATTSLEDVGSIGPMCLFQLYLFKDRRVTLDILHRVRKAGYKAIVLTVDTPMFGRRERDRKNKFQLSPHLTFANFAEDPTSQKSGDANRSVLESLSGSIDADLSLHGLQWVVEHAGLPVWVKGVVRGDDAVRAVEAGAAAVVVSNHGGRQLEGCIPTMCALEEVVQAIQGRVPVLVDSGIRSGEDVVKACALGATAVLLGRPVLWALAKNGEQGVTDLLREYQEGIELTMRLCGARSVAEINRDMVVTQNPCKL